MSQATDFQSTIRVFLAMIYLMLALRLRPWAPGDLPPKDMFAICKKIGQRNLDLGCRVRP